MKTSCSTRAGRKGVLTDLNGSLDCDKTDSSVCRTYLKRIKIKQKTHHNNTLVSDSSLYAECRVSSVPLPSAPSWTPGDSPDAADKGLCDR